MNRAIFTFSKPTANGITASARIARFASEQLDAPLYHDHKIAARWDVLYIVAGAYAFCDALPHIGKAVEQAGRVVWIQNDYTIVPPKAQSNAESPFRKAFRLRRAAGLPGIDYWTTIGKLATATPMSRYINWNMLTWNPQPVESGRERDNKVLYYGAFRQNRLKAFDRFFNMRGVPWRISNNTDKFEARYPHLKDVVKNIPRDYFNEFLAQHRLGLYIEDEKSHTEFHSPANRFYEMLGAGLPMVFQKESVGMLAQAGLDVRPWVVDTEAEVLRAAIARNADNIRLDQAAQFARDYLKDLKKAVQKARKEIES